MNSASGGMVFLPRSKRVLISPSAFCRRWVRPYECLIPLVSRCRDIAICASCAFSMKDGHTAFFMPSILAAWRYC